MVLLLGLVGTLKKKTLLLAELQYLPGVAGALTWEQKSSGISISVQFQREREINLELSVEIHSRIEGKPD